MSEADASDSSGGFLLEKLAACDTLMARWLKRVCVGLLGLMVLTITTSIVTRFVIFHPLNFADPLAKYLMMWCAFLGIGIALREGEHIAVELLKNRLKCHSADLLQWALDGFICLFLGAVVYFGLIFAASGWDSRDPFVFGVSMTIPYLSVPVGAGLAIAQLALSALARHQREKVKRRTISNSLR